MNYDFKFCPNCATELQFLTLDEDGGPKERLRCPACGYTHWNNPTPVLAAVIEMADRDGQVLLARNAAWTHRMFALITGFMEAGETPEEGIAREVMEETSLKAESLDLIGVYDREIGMLERHIHQHLRYHSGYQAVQAINGVGRTIAAILVAEIGDVSRFPTPRHLCSWAGLTPRHRESDTTVHRGPITKQGSKLVRWAAIEACQHTRAGTKLSADRSRIIAARGRNIGIVAAARRLLTLVYYGLRDGEIRTLAARAG
jgi:ADP-ribose pyrophosphatase YjhB (NUDIX family)